MEFVAVRSGLPSMISNRREGMRRIVLLVLGLLLLAASCRAGEEKPAPSPVAAAELSPEMAALSEEIRTAFQRGMEHFNAKRFSEAYDAFYEAMVLKPDHVEVNFWLGRSAFEAENYEAAVMAFDRVLMMHPDLLRVKLELGRAYARLGNRVMAKKEFEDVLAKNPPEQVRKNIESVLAAMDAAEKKTSAHSIHGAFTLGFGYDDNVNSGPVDRDIKTRLGEVVLGDTSMPAEDTSHSETLSLGHVYRIGQSDFSWKTDGVFHVATTTILDKYDLNLALGSSGLAYSKGRFSLEARATAMTMQLDYDQYLTSYGYTLNGSVILTPNAFLGLSYREEYKNYHKNQEKEAVNRNVGLGPVFIFGKNRLSPRLAWEMENARAETESYERLIGSLRIDRELPRGFGIFSSARQQATEYEAPQALFGIIREDNVYDLTVGFNKIFTASLSGEIRATHTDSFSNIELYDYKKNAVELSLTWRF